MTIGKVQAATVQREETEGRPPFMGHETIKKMNIKDCLYNVQSVHVYYTAKLVNKELGKTGEKFSRS